MEAREEGSQYVYFLNSFISVIDPERIGDMSESVS